MLVNIERLHSMMDQDGLDGIVATTLPNVQYFADFQSIALAGHPFEAQCYVAFTQNAAQDPIVVTSTVEMDQLLDGNARKVARVGTFYREGPIDDISLSKEEQWLKVNSMDTPGFNTPIDGLVAVLKDLDLVGKKIGIDEMGLLGGYLEKLRDQLPQTNFVPASSRLRWVRKVKTEDEVKRLRKSARITEQAICSAAAIAREGVTEYEMAREFERSIVSQGGRPKFTLIRFGRNAVAGQRIPGKTQLKKGDTIWFDVGSTYKGYWSDIARIYCLGEPGERVKNLYRALLAGEEIGIAKTRIGMTGSELYQVVMEAVGKAGHPNYRRHHVGHGIGTEVYELPILRPDNQDTIEEGCLINIETPYYEFGLGALHVEDPYVVHANGNHEILTTLSRELHVIPD